MYRVSISFVLCVLVLMAGIVPESTAQLISPGKLSSPHKNLEGMTNCTQCHTLGSRSVDKNLCLDCHTPLATRIEAGTGYHASIEIDNCASCHKEHFGVEFIPVRFDTLNFNHEETGFELTGSHEEASCKSCHQPDFITAEDVIAFKGEHEALEKTFLGADTQCIGCHLPDSPHQEQFESENCDTCHQSEEWEEAPLFDHDDAAFALTGAHTEVSCEGCHKTIEAPGIEPYVQYVDLDFANCSSCHEDVHEGSFGSNCASCHQTQSWGRINMAEETEFDHTSTGFELIGSHAGLTCASCHQRPARSDEEIEIQFVFATRNNTYPAIVTDNCSSCHVDYHEGELADYTGSCEQCHSEEAWYPSSYDLSRHNEEAGFELTGGHLATPCSSCHQPANQEKPHFELADTTCEGCHVEDNPHGDQFEEETCESCHNTDEWLIAEIFDHDSTSFALTGQHISTPCADCHVSEHPTWDPPSPVVYRETSAECAVCHQEDDPHENQFENESCETCHTTNSFFITEYDHDETRFPLTGEHKEVQCGACHKEEVGVQNTPFVRFKPLGITCESCHDE